MFDIGHNVDFYKATHVMVEELDISSKLSWVQLICILINLVFLAVVNGFYVYVILTQSASLHYFCSILLVIDLSESGICETNLYESISPKKHIEVSSLLKSGSKNVDIKIPFETNF